MSNVNIRVVAWTAAAQPYNRPVNILSAGAGAAIPAHNQITEEQYQAMSLPDRQGIPTWVAAPGSPNVIGLHTIAVVGYSADGFALREDSGLALREDGGRELRE